MTFKPPIPGQFYSLGIRPSKVSGFDIVREYTNREYPPEILVSNLSDLKESYKVLQELKKEGA